MVTSREIALLKREVERDERILPEDRARANIDIGFVTAIGAMAAFFGLVVVIIGVGVGAGLLFPQSPAAILALFPAAVAWLVGTNHVYLRFVRSRLKREIERAHVTPALASASAELPVAVPAQPSP